MWPPDTPHLPSDDAFYEHYGNNADTERVSKSFTNVVFHKSEEKLMKTDKTNT